MRRKITDRTLTRKPPKAGQVEIWDTLLPGFGLRISYGGRRTYFVMTRILGSQVRRTIGTTAGVKLAEAREAARDILRDAGKGIDSASPKARAAALERMRAESDRAQRNTFRAVAEDYLADTRKGGGGALRSRDELQRKLDRDIFPEWGSRPISGITRADVKALIRKKAVASPVSANRLAALIKTIFNWAIDEDVIEASPAVRIRPEPETPRARVLTDAEVRDVWRGAERVGFPFGPFVQFLLLTGQRRAEVAGLRWSEIEPDGWRLPGERTKTGSGHLVPLSEQALSILQDCPQFEGADHVFAATREIGRKDDKQTVSFDKALSGWSKLKRRLDAGILEVRREDAKGKVEPLADWTLHDLRRTCATGMQSLGVSDDVVDRILNHALPGVRKTYNRFARNPEKEAALTAWGRHVAKVVSGKASPVRGVRRGA
jgi:integrase